ncbi:hypothetical protein [Heyndrickxia oleronia]|uniref:hypothetical protein n=1 Tax=Heyndrickxia oleronia TaxID=38875 RepID=UPI0024695A7C|nr:hypothetical protein [Heyndrickxia oleronia]
MQTDISPENVERKIIKDTKYYQHTFSQNKGVLKLNSGNLYEIFAYLSNGKKGREKETICILLYTQTGQEV